LLSAVIINQQIHTINELHLTSSCKNRSEKIKRAQTRDNHVKLASEILRLTSRWKALL